MKWLTRGTILFLVVGCSALLFTPFCHFLYHCGCQGMWAAGSKFCNVHTPGIAHCPWCSTGSWGVYLPKAAVWLAQIGIVLIPSRLSNKARLVAGLLAFLVVGAAAGYVFGLLTNYPTFLSHRL